MSYESACKSFWMDYNEAYNERDGRDVLELPPDTGKNSISKRGIHMLQTMMQQNVLLYAIGILSTLGVISQIWLWGVYGRMTKDMENERNAKGKFVRQIRQRYGLLKRMGSGDVNTEIFIKRSLHQYRHLGSSLHQWRRMGVYAMGLGIAAGIVGYYISGTNVRLIGTREQYLWAMGISALGMGLVYALTDIRYKRNYLEMGLLDMLENAGPVQTGKKTEKIVEQSFDEAKTEVPGMEKMETDISASQGRLSLKKGRKQNRESRAVEEKRELQENLSRIKASMRESAAGMEREKERNTEILKNMDSEEQERVIREVLKEFLS